MYSCAVCWVVYRVACVCVHTLGYTSTWHVLSFCLSATISRAHLENFAFVPLYCQLCLLCVVGCLAVLLLCAQRLANVCLINCVHQPSTHTNATFSPKSVSKLQLQLPSRIWLGRCRHSPTLYNVYALNMKLYFVSRSQHFASNMLQ